MNTPYITKEDIEMYSGLNIDGSADDFITMLIAAVSDYISKAAGAGLVTRREFGLDSEADSTTRKYDGTGATKLMIDDVLSIDTLVVDDETLTEDTDFFLCPANALADGKPYEWIELAQPALGNRSSRSLSSNNPFVFTVDQRNVVVTGKFGYSTDVPPVIKLACLKLATAVIKENVADSDVREVSSETLGDYSVSFGSVSNTANAIKVDTLLDGYLRTGIPVKYAGILQAAS